MPSAHVIGVDLATVRDESGREEYSVLGWGDSVNVEDDSGERVKIRTFGAVKQPDGSVHRKPVTGYIRKTVREGRRNREVVVPRESLHLLRMEFVDVQQGDASVVETPGGKVMLVDGGENQLFARYLANRFAGTKEKKPKEIDCIVVTHGDADHFEGLSEIQASQENKKTWKQFWAKPLRVYHNGLVKRPAKVGELKMLGATVPAGDDELVITGLETDLLAVDDAQMNAPFKRWKAALRKWQTQNGNYEIDFKRLAKGDDRHFHFLAEPGLKVEVLGPILKRTPAGEGLPFLRKPREGARVSHPTGTEPEYGAKSASHTINGHSVVLRMTFKKWRFLFAGDLNNHAEDILTREHERGNLSLRSEIFKVPHHGSHEFSSSFFKAVAPVVSVVSSGDESEAKEYIHPRATLMSALGKYGRGEKPVVFVTELTAFFQAVGWILPEDNPPKDMTWSRRKHQFFAFERSAWGIVRVRTDGERLLVYTDSGKRDMKEAYAYTMERGRPVPQELLRA